MTFDFDTPADRSTSDSEKWRHYGPGVLPLWVADTDFRAPEPVIRALRERVEHGVFGYGGDPLELRRVIVERLQRRYGWQVAPEMIVFTPTVASGFHLACRAVAAPGDGVLVQPPVYPPIVCAHARTGLAGNEAKLTRRAGGSYSVDLAAFEQAITPRTRLFLLCNPHNPVGRVFRRDELEGMAEICLRHNVLICSDEIHCDIVYTGHTHLPIAGLSPEIARRTITLMAPSKTFNIPGLKLAFAVIPDAELRKQYAAWQGTLAGSPSVLSVAAATAAYRDCEAWLEALHVYLQANRDFVHEFVRTRLPGISMGKPEATFLAWLDCRKAGIAGNPYEFFLKQAKVALNDGAPFGRGGEGFVRLNFGCPRSTLVAALERMSAAL